MSKGKFKAGVHPYEGKEFAASKEIKRLKGEEIMVFPMSTLSVTLTQGVAGAPIC